MPDFDKLDQCVMLAKALWFLPPPARAKFAECLYDLGARMHPELATHNLLVDGPEGLGDHRPRMPVRAESRRDAENIIRTYLPDLADKMAAAQTEQQKQALLSEIRRNYPAAIARAERQMASLSEDSR